MKRPADGNGQWRRCLLCVQTSHRLGASIKKGFKSTKLVRLLTHQFGPEAGVKFFQAAQQRRVGQLDQRWRAFDAQLNVAPVLRMVDAGGG